jgi:hypothetical protein
VSPQVTRAGQGPAKTPDDILRVVRILAGRSIRADQAAPGTATIGDFNAGRRQGYVQAIAELLGTTATEVDRALRNDPDVFDVRRLTGVVNAATVNPTERTD